MRTDVSDYRRFPGQLLVRVTLRPFPHSCVVVISKEQRVSSPSAAEDSSSRHRFIVDVNSATDAESVWEKNKENIQKYCHYLFHKRLTDLVTLNWKLNY